MPITQNIKTQMNAPGAAPMFACRAWVNFDGTGAVGTNQTIRKGGNVASVFKNGTGDYTINFSEAMPDEKYALLISFTNPFSSSVSRNAGYESATGYTVNGCRVVFWYMTDTGSQAYFDPDIVSIAAIA